jgi:AraC-like DNA-binding protein
MQLAVYDLVGALFVPDSWSGSRPTDKLFARILSIIMDRLADPDLGPHELATDAGISLRFIHKLFAERGSSCREFIYSLRLDHAAHLLNRRSGKAQPLSEIAYGCGFATILISHESSAIGSVTRQVPTPARMFNMLATDLCTAIPRTVRRGLTTGSAPTKYI